MPAQVLLVGHKANDSQRLLHQLEAAGYHASSVAVEEATLSWLSERNADVFLLGQSLSLSRCLTLCHDIQNGRRRFSPRLFVMSDGGPSHRIECLQAGADDCIAGSISIGELLARFTAVLRRVAPQFVSETLQFKDLQLDRATHRVTRGRRVLSLSPKEFVLLECLLENRGRTQPHSRLIKSVWGSETSVSRAALAILMVRLRRALSESGEADPIRTVRGIGYVVGDEGSS